MSLFGSISRAFSGIVRTAAPLVTSLAPTILSGGVIPPGILNVASGFLNPTSPSSGPTYGGGSTGYMPDPGLMMAQRRMSPIQTWASTNTEPEENLWSSDDEGEDQTDYEDEDYEYSDEDEY